MGLWSLPWEGCDGSSSMGDEEAVVASLPSSGLSMVGCTHLVCLRKAAGAQVLLVIAKA